MVAKLYRVAENSYVVADDVFIQQGEFIDGSEGDWVSSAPLDEEELEGLISGEVELYDFDLDADQAEDFEEFVEVPQERWATLSLL